MILLLEKLRWGVFWFKDFLAGGRLKRHYKDVQFILEQYDSEISAKKRNTYLNRILKHAVTTTSLYESYKDFTSLTDFPVVNKLVLKEKYEELQSRDYKEKAHFKMSTSGSTGTPLTILQNKDKKLRNTADTLYFAKQGGYTLGNRIYYIRGWSKRYKKNKLMAFGENIKMINVTDFSDEYLAKFIKIFSTDPSHKAILGYPSAFKELCRYLDRNNVKPVNTNTTSIIAIAEALSDHTRSAMEKYFNKPVISRYSNMENGIFAQQFLDKGSRFHINWASYYIELLHPDRDVPVANGELGRVVITDLFNFCMPIIRYDTGDLAVMDYTDSNFNKAPKINRVEGRKMDILYDTKGHPKSPFIINYMDNFSGIKQFQLVQENQFNYTLILNVDGEFTAESEVTKILQQFLGSDAIINYRYVEEIPELSSGKRRLTVNNYRQK